MLLKPRPHVIILDELSTVGLSQTFPDSRAETRTVFHQAQRCIPDKMLRISTSTAGNLSELRLLIASEMDFHTRKIRIAQAFYLSNTGVTVPRN